MAACDVCLDLNWDLYSAGKHVDVESTHLALSASRGCVPCRIIKEGIELIEKEVVLPAGGESHLVYPGLLQIHLRKNRGLFVEISSIDDYSVRKNYEIELEFFSIAGTGVPITKERYAEEWQDILHHGQPLECQMMFLCNQVLNCV